jgi:nucleotide-binding universal stress UspA family protein
LTAQVRRIEEIGGTVAEAHLRNGSAVDEILDLGEELRADLLIMGSRGLGTLGRLVMGSVSDGVAHHATRSVLVLRGGERAWPPSRIVVGVDLHEESKGAAKLGVGLGNLFEAEVHLVLAYPRFPQFSTQRVAAQSEAWTSEEGVRQAEEALEDFATELQRESGSALRTRAVVGDAATAIVEVAEEGLGPSLALVGGRDLEQLVRIRLGSVSSDVLRAAGGPVLIHKRPAG